jgi:hypothetical protein
MEVSGWHHTWSTGPSQKELPVSYIGWDALWLLYDGEENSSRNETLLVMIYSPIDVLYSVQYYYY